MVADNEGFLYPYIDNNSCTDCGICQSVCPMLVDPPKSLEPMAFAAWTHDEATRKDSSSGGVFSALMHLTLQQGGVIFGAAFDATMTLQHQSAESVQDVTKFRGSKYVQSIIGNVYQSVDKYLAHGRKVLFSGTPCQVAGLYAYIGKDNSNLTTCDVVCHGVPSPKVFSAYREVLEKRYGGTARRIAFRCKDYGWKQYSVSLSFDNDTEYRSTLSEDPFMKGFLDNIYLRPSCHMCPFSRLPRVADISLGDFWGVGGHHPEWDDDKGTSLVLVQTEKGERAFKSCCNLLTIHAAELNVAIQSNACICGSVAPGIFREAFFNDFGKLPFEEVMKKYMNPPSLFCKLINKVRRIFNSLFQHFRTA